MRPLIPIFALLFGFAGTSHGQQYALRPTPGSKLAFNVYKGGVMAGKKHDFTFDSWSGTLDFNAKNPTESKVKLTIDAKSLKCFDDWSPAKGSIDKIVKFAFDEVLEVSKNPTISFVSTAMSQQGTDSYQVDGNLTIRGVTKPAKINVMLKPMGNVRLFEGSTKIDMTAFGIKPPTAALGTIKTKPEMTMSFNLKAE